MVGASNMYGENKCTQGFGDQNWRKQATWKTQA